MRITAITPHTGVACSAMCSCEIPQIEGLDAIAECSAGAETSDGFCYSDTRPAVEHCPPNAKRAIRLPRIEDPEGASLTLVCDG